MIKNKRGNMGLIIFFFVLLFLIMFTGFLMIVGSSILNFVWDESVPILSDLGVVEDSNITEYASYTIAPVNTVIQNFTWLTGVLYVMMLIGSVGFAFIMKTTPSRWLMVFYFLCVILLVTGAIIMSNIYEDFQDDSGELGDRLNEHFILSFMLLHSPIIFTVISFITGIVLFSGMQEEEFV